VIAGAVTHIVVLRGEGWLAGRKAPAVGVERKAIAAYAKGARFEIAADDWFYDPGVSGADPIETRTIGFMIRPSLALIQSKRGRASISFWTGSKATACAS